MVKLTKHTCSSKEEMFSPASGLRRRRSAILKIFSKPWFTKGVSRGRSEQKELEKEMAIERATRRAAMGMMSVDSLENLMRALNRADRIAAFDSQRTNKIGPAFPARYGNNELIFFRCDIHGTDGGDFAEAEKECKQLVLEAGGTVMSEYEYLGGFLYNFPADVDFINPLADGDETLGGGHVKISPWKPFITKRLDPLRMNPPGPLITKQPPTPPPKDDPPDGNDPADEDPDDDVQGQTSEEKVPPAPPNTETSDTEVDTKKTQEDITPPMTPKERVQSWILRQNEKAEEEQNRQPGPRSESLLTLRKDFDDDLSLSPRILDPGVELAIIDPNLIRSGASHSRMSVLRAGSRASWCEKEVYYPDGETAVEEPAEEAQTKDDKSISTYDGSSNRYSGVEATAIRIRIGAPTHSPSFGEEMRRVEEIYRNWVPEMTSRTDLGKQEAV